MHTYILTKSSAKQSGYKKSARPTRSLISSKIKKLSIGMTYVQGIFTTMISSDHSCENVL